MAVAENATQPDPLKLARRGPLLAVNRALIGPSSSPSPTAAISNAKLDSSLKKHTSLLARLRQGFPASSRDALLKDVNGLTLEKYLEEIVGAIVEGASGSSSMGKGKSAESEVAICVEFLTRLHQRFPDPLKFLQPLTVSLLAQMAPPSLSHLKSLASDQREREEKDRLLRQRSVARLLAEMGLVGLRAEVVLVAKKSSKEKAVVEEGDKWAIEDVLKGLLTSDASVSYASLPLFITFLKSYARAYLGPNASPEPTDTESPEVVEELVPIEVQARLREMFMVYYHALIKVVNKGRERLAEQDRRNHEAYVKSGEIFEDRQQAYEKMTKEIERLMNGLTSLAEALGATLPTFSSLQATKSAAGILVLDPTSSLVTRSIDDVPLGGIWGDDEERRFYEDLVDLKDFVPASLLGIKQEKEEEKAEREKKEKEEVMRQLETLEIGGESSEAPKEEAAKEETVDDSVPESQHVMASPKLESSVIEPETTDDPIASGPAARLNVIFNAMPEASSKATFDQLVVDFAFLNTKASRNRVIKHLGAVHKNRSDLLPYYARFAATLNPYMPDVGQGLIAILDEEFKYLQRKKLVKELAEVRSKNVRYFSELAKFGVAPPHTILHVFKVFVDDLTGSNVDCAALLLESCGRYLLRSETTGERMKSLLEAMRRKQSAQHFDQRQLLLLENAYYQCNPPERAAVEQKQREPMDLFIRHLIYDVLIKKTVDKVLKLLRKLHWEDPKVAHILHKAFTKVWKLKFSNIGAMAMLVYDLQRYQSAFTVGVVDQVLEDIRSGLETNIFKYNQRRIATMKYLGELHYYRQVSSTVIFDVLWSLITFGHSEPIPIPGRTSADDAVDDFFRIRLICTLLDTCGVCFDRGAQKRKLDNYLIIFQLYVLCKADPPMDVEFMISDTLEQLQPKLVPFKTFQEAAAAVDGLLSNQVGDLGDDEDEGESQIGSERAEEEEEEEDIDIDDEEGDLGAVSGQEDQDDVYLLREAAPKPVDPQEEQALKESEEEFAREFAKILMEDKKGDRKVNAPIFDTALPVLRRSGARSDKDDLAPAAEAQDHNSMRFMLLTKKGNKPQTRAMNIPMDSAIAVNTRSNQNTAKLEQQQMKQLVLTHEMRQDLAEKAALEKDAAARGIKLRFVNPA